VWPVFALFSFLHPIAVGAPPLLIDNTPLRINDIFVSSLIRDSPAS
jgi:hypothetical protein